MIEQDPASPFWQEVHRVTAALPPSPVLFVTSKPEPRFIASGGRAGVTAEVTRRHAALLIAGRTHRLATDSETATFVEDLARRTREAVATQQRAAGKSVILGPGPEAPKK